MLPAAKFLNYIKQNSLFKPQERILLALSGGRDSVFMVHLFQESGFNFAIAHVNFQLRGAESDGDEDFCRTLAAQCGVPFFSTAFDTQSYSQKHQLSIQMAARQLRYAWLERIRQENGYDFIALAHHQNDSIETVLLNLVRGTGVSGLHGILPKRAHLLRPLLCFTRTEIDDWVEQQGISYREDSSNESVKYARNKIRLEVIPKLKELNPALEETFEANRRRMAELEELLHDRVAALRRDLFLALNDEQIAISVAALKQLKPINTLLFELFRPYGFSESVLHDLQQSWNGQSGKVFESATYRLLLDRDNLLLSPLPGNEPIAETVVFAQQGDVYWNQQQFKVEIRSAENFTLDTHPAKAQLDADLLVFPLVLRTWQLGDVFQPLGMKTKKKISDFFISNKVPLNKKSRSECFKMVMEILFGLPVLGSVSAIKLVQPLKKYLY